MARTVLAGCAFGALVVALSTTPAAAASVERFHPTGPLVLSATAGDGTPVLLDVLVPSAELTGQPSGFDLASPPAGDTYFEVVLEARPITGSPNFAGYGDLPDGAITLEADGRTVPPLDHSTGGLASATYVFAVPEGLATAALVVTATTLTAQEQTGSNPLPASTTLSVDGAQLLLVADANSSAVDATKPSAPHPHRAKAHRGSGGPLPIALGAGAGGALALGAAIAGLVSFRRRRAFYRAHDEGRLVFLAAPLAVSIAGAVGRSTDSPERTITVKILGWLEIAGIRTPTENIPLPVRELVAYLVLNRGRRFTSLQLIESIWCIGRRPIERQTLRKYVVQFRKVMGPGILVTEGYTYALTDAVGCDLAEFNLAAEDGDQPAGGQRALTLVRGPVLHGCFASTKNAPFAWAEQLANDTELEITDLARRVGSALLNDGALGEADSAVSAGLRCQPSNLVLRLLDLDVALATGGQAELARRLRAGGAALAEFSADVERLEEHARRLGVEATVRR